MTFIRIDEQDPVCNDRRVHHKHFRDPVWGILTTQKPGTARGVENASDGPEKDRLA